MDKRLINFALYFLAAFIGCISGIAIVSLVLEHPKMLGGDWWDIMTAIGTTLTALGAIYSVRIAIKTFKSDLSAKQEQAKLHLLSHAPSMTNVISLFEEASFFMDGYTLRSKNPDSINLLLTILSSLDKYQTSKISPKLNDAVIRSIYFLEKAKITLNAEDYYKLKPGEITLIMSSGLPVFMEMLRSQLNDISNAANSYMLNKPDWDNKLATF